MNPFGIATLQVVKSVPRVARVGDTVGFELTVRNVGPGAAVNMLMTDVPPAALALTGLRLIRRAQLVRGNAVSRLGTLPAGATRTVRGSVRIKSGTPGLNATTSWRRP